MIKYMFRRLKMIEFIKRLFGFSAKPVEVAPSAPYKLPESLTSAPVPLGVEAYISTPVGMVETKPVVAPVAETKPAAPAITATKKKAEPKAPAKAKPKAKAPAKPRAAKKPNMTVAK